MIDNNISKTVDFIKVIKSISQKKENLENKNQFVDVSDKPLEIMLFTGYNEMDIDKRIITNKGNVKQMFSDISYSNVPIVGIGLGNYKGIYTPIKMNELALVGWLDRNTPIILGSVNDYLTLTKDIIPQIKEDELVIVAKTLGSTIFFRNDNTIKIKSITGGEVTVGENVLIKNLDGGQILVDGDITITNATGGVMVVDSTGVKASGYKSSDGTAGATADVTVTEDGGGTKTFHFKNGLFTGT